MKFMYFPENMLTIICGTALWQREKLHCVRGAKR